MSPGLSVGLSVVVAPPRPTTGKLKSLTLSEFDSIGLMTPPNVRLCFPLLHVRSSRIVGTRTNLFWELMRAKGAERPDRKSTRLNSSHLGISYAVFCLKKKKK